jgi:hypothetical protein
MPLCLTCRSLAAVLQPTAEDFDYWLAMPREELLERREPLRAAGQRCGCACSSRAGSLGVRQHQCLLRGSFAKWVVETSSGKMRRRTRLAPHPLIREQSSSFARIAGERGGREGDVRA